MSLLLTHAVPTILRTDVSEKLFRANFPESANEVKKKNDLNFR